MKSFNEYMSESEIANIVEALDGEDTSKNTRNNEQRKKELEKWLKGKPYHDYIETLNKMLEDPKAKALLQAGFGGELGDYKLKFEMKVIPVKNLLPTQSEIDVTKSVDFPIKKRPEGIAEIYKNAKSGVEIMMPLVTFRANYVIDGHHRWSQVYAMNPDANMICANYDGNISPRQMLKACQGAIAAVQADTDQDSGIPSNEVNGANLFDDKWNEEAITKYLDENMSDEAVKIFCKVAKKKGVTDKESAVRFVTENLLNLKSNNDPEQGAPNRGDMPQTDKGGTNPDDNKTAGADDEGSALNKLKDDKFVKGAVQ